MKIKTNKKEGFTLVEILFYFVILSFMLVSIMSFSITVLNLTKESDNLHEIQAGIDYISQKIIYTVETASSINVAESIFDNNNGKLSLNMSVAGNSPTSFYLLDGAVYIKEGEQAAVKINSDSIRCTELKFQKISYTKTPDQVVIDAEFEPLNSEISNLRQVLPFHTSVSLRKL